MQTKKKKDDFLSDKDKIIEKEIERLVAKYPEFKLKGYIITRIQPPKNNNK